jgi:hypothetical protein
LIVVALTNSSDAILEVPALGGAGNDRPLGRSQILLFACDPIQTVAKILDMSGANDFLMFLGSQQSRVAGFKSINAGLQIGILRRSCLRGKPQGRVSGQD